MGRAAHVLPKGNPEYKAPYNRLFNIPRVFTPEDRTIQRPNPDTPYSWIGLDLRAEPIVFTVPPIEKTRYWSLQLIDLYTHNFDYLGTRTTGNDGGSFMIAGPGWRGETPKGIKKVIRSETEIASAQFRTQLFNPGDLDNVKKIQVQYIVKPLSAFLGQPAPKAVPAIDFPKPLKREAQRTSLEFFYRMAGAVLGIYGNSKEEAMYPAYFVDADGKQPNGANRYTLRFAPRQLPPVDAFWSLTMYDDPDGLLVANPLNRYLLNSTMLDQFKRDADGGLTLLIQHDSPGKDKEANWLPAPKGPFSMILRLYLPKAEALDGTWKQPPLKKVS